MPLRDPFIAEFDHETAGTRAVLERLPEDPLPALYGPSADEGQIGV